MTRRTRTALVAGAALMALGAMASAGTGAPGGPVKPDPAAQAAQDQHRSFGRIAPGPAVLVVTFADRPTRTEALSRLEGLGTLRPVVPEAGVWSLRGSAIDRDAVLGRAQVAAAEWSLERLGDQAESPRPPYQVGEATPITDPLYVPDQQWGLFQVGWTSALASRPRPRVAILDSGVDVDHPEWGGTDSPLVAPYSTQRDVREADDWSVTGHGTHVAGVAAAPINGIGIVGVAPAKKGTAEVIPVQIADRAGSSTDDTMMRGIRWAVRNGAKVINISAGGPGFSRAFQDTILWASQRGALVVASVGNEGLDVNRLNYPAAYPRVLGVGALCDRTTTFDCPSAFGVASFSNRNRTVDVIAPGVSILSTIPRGVREGVVTPGYGLKDGTSMATPFVTGLAALVMANNPDTPSPFQVHRQITNTATDIGARGRDDRAGYGVVNPQAAVTLQLPHDDTEEVNDDIKFVGSGKRAAERRKERTISASIDQIEDPDDVYGVVLRKGDRVRATLDYRKGRGQVDLYLWAPTTRTVRVTGQSNLKRNLVDYSGRRTGRRQVVVKRVTKSGRYYLNAFARRGGGDYTLRVTVVRGG